MLENLINELSFDFSLLIKDTYTYPGLDILISTVSSLKNETPTIKIVTVGLNEDFKEPVHGRYECKHIALDPVQLDSPNYFVRILDELPSSQCCVILDSLSLLSMTVSTQLLACLVRHVKLNPHVSHLLGLLHKDVMTCEESSSVEHLFESIIDLIPLDKELQSSYHGHSKCFHHKKSGKVDSSDEYFLLNDDFSLKLVHSSTSANIKTFIESNSADIIPQLTFNLTLNDQERNAKNRLQLPYLKNYTEKEALLKETHNRSGAPTLKIGVDAGNTSTSGGKIYYQYDEADDFDEEDPDDDLDI